MHASETGDGYVKFSMGQVLERIKGKKYCKLDYQNLRLLYNLSKICVYV
jgi:hypothetical protein